MESRKCNAPAPYCCPICFKTTEWKGNMTRHMREVHHKIRRIRKPKTIVQTTNIHPDQPVIQNIAPVPTMTPMNIPQVNPTPQPPPPPPPPLILADTGFVIVSQSLTLPVK